MILAIDTATRWAGLALHSGTAVIAEYGWYCANNHTVELTPTMLEMFSQAGVTAAHLSGVAVTIGPGSYTGLRVGLGVAKGLALANQTPLIGISTLDVIAAAFGPLPGQLLAVAEAGRTRICAVVYRWQERKGWLATGQPLIDSWANILSLIDKPTLFAGEITAEAAKLVRAANKQFHVALPAASIRRAGFLAEIGWQRLRKGQVDEASTLIPVYLKNPDGS